MAEGGHRFQRVYFFHLCCLSVKLVYLVTINFIYFGGKGTVIKTDSDAVPHSHVVHGLEHFVVLSGNQDVPQAQNLPGV